MFCIKAWIDFYLLGSDGLDVAVIWWVFFFFPLFGFLVPVGFWWVVGMVVVVVVW